jgi:dTDP-glucose pyrophosphorylase
MDAIILAAGRSQRFGENKLLIPFDSLTLTEHSLKFLAENGITGKIVIVINKSDVYISNRDKIIQPVMHRLLGSPYYSENIEFVFQNPDEYGPAAAIRSAAGKIKDDFIILSGDNYYSGKIDTTFPDGATAKATYRYLPDSELNLRLAYVNLDENKIIEKPHNFSSGEYYCGYMMLKYEELEKVNTMEISPRGEYEITDFFNSSKKKAFEPLSIKWTDITFYEDIPTVLKYIKENANN